MKLEYDYKNVDWKEVKERWDKAPMHFYMFITHGTTEIGFQAFLDKKKQYKIWLFINGRYKSEYMDKGHEFAKYHLPVEKLPSKKLIAIERKFDKSLKKLTDKQVIEKQEMFVWRGYRPWFDNIAQIKKMVTALE